MMLYSEIINRQEFFMKNGRHPKDSLIIVLDGSFTCKMSGKIYTVNKNNIFVFNSNAYFERKVIMPIKCIYIQFDIFPMPLSNGIMKICDLGRTKNTILYLEQAIRSGNYSHIKHFVDDIFMLYTWDRDSMQVYGDSTVSSCIDFFVKNYSAAINLDILAKNFNISKQWLIVKFKKYTNKTPMEYLNEIRLHYGKTFLTDTDLPVGEIANKCGFETIYYFSSAFKNHIGVSPSQYRKKFQL